MLKIRNPRLPSGYTELTYIEGNGNQYIDTGLKREKIRRYEVDFNQTTDTSNVWICGCEYNFECGSWQGSWYTNARFTYSQNESFLIRTQASGTNTILANDYTMTIFTRGNLTIARAKAQLYSFKVYESDVLAYDFVPAKRISDNVVGLYEVINGVFYQSKTGTNFIAGEEVQYKTISDLKIKSGDTLVSIDTLRVATRNIFRFPTKYVSISANPTSQHNTLETDMWYNSFAYNGYGAGYSTITTMNENEITFTSSSPSYCPTKFLKLKPSTQYTVSFVGSSRSSVALMKYSKNASGKYVFHKYIFTPSNSPKTFTTDVETNDDLYGFLFYGNANVTQTYSNIQIEEGATATSYVPYFAKIYEKGE